MTTEMSSTEDIIGRKEIDDLEAILSVVGTEEADGRHVVHSDYDTIFTWDYEKGARPKLNKLYEKAKNAQWNGETDLPWDTDVDQEKLVVIAAELRERQEFAFEAAVRMRDRFLQQEVWDRMGVDPKTILPVVLSAPDRNEFQALLFSKIVPNCRKLGLLDAADGWLRTKFTELGVIEFESAVDTSEEYDAMAAVPPSQRELI